MKNFWKDESGQDLIEYALLLGFVALFGAASMYAGIQTSITNVWTAAQTAFTNAGY